MNLTECVRDTNDCEMERGCNKERIKQPHRHVDVHQSLKCFRVK